MQFLTSPVSDAVGAVLAHSVRAGGRVMRKGRLLSQHDVAAMIESGVHTVMIARLDPADVPEDEAAARIATLCAAGDGVRIGAAFTGRANLYATAAGLAVIDPVLIDRLNAIDESITLATVAPSMRVAQRQMLATVKIIPYAAERKHVEAAEALLHGCAPIAVAAFRPRRVALISTFLPETKLSLLDKNRSALEQRLHTLESRIVLERRVAHAVEPLAAAIAEAKGCDPILIFGASAITDRRDTVPAAIERAGGTIEAFGMPVDPGNLLLSAQLGGATVIGLPGCARSPKLNGFDFVLWRIAASLPVGRGDLAAMGVGGLLSEIPTRPQPRDEPAIEAPALPQIGAVVLAAGLSSRMGSNKLLAPVGGKPLVRHAVEAALASAAHPVIVVTGNGGAEVRSALSGLPVAFAENRDVAAGLSGSLRCGLAALGDDCNGVMFLLGDMPDVSAGLIDKLIAAFDPSEDRAICVATRHGRRGNPVLWARRFFPEIMALEGDIGAKHLMAVHADLVCEVEAADDGPLTDIDTPEALAAYRAR
jgi:molybdenum cofactor cytidylyltransferase